MKEKEEEETGKEELAVVPMADVTQKETAKGKAEETKTKCKRGKAEKPEQNTKWGKAEGTKTKRNPGKADKKRRKLAASTLAVGSRALISGLKAKTEFNQKACNVIRTDGERQDRFEVRILPTGKEINIRRECLEPKLVTEVIRHFKTVEEKDGVTLRVIGANTEGKPLFRLVENNSQHGQITLCSVRDIGGAWKGYEIMLAIMRAMLYGVIERSKQAFREKRNMLVTEAESP